MRSTLRYLLAFAYVVAGIAHLWSPAGFVQITPAWVPLPNIVVFLTGLCEIAGGVAFAMVAQLRRMVGICLAAYAVLVFPANINHALNDIAIGGVDLSWWYHGPRLLFQPVIIWCTLWTSGVMDWPFGGRDDR